MFLYHVKDMKEKPTAADLKPYGLEYVANGGFMFCKHESGGFVIGPEDCVIQRYIPKADWKPLAEYTGETFHANVTIAMIGEKANPEKIQTTGFQGGLPVELNDGNVWIIPMAKTFNRSIEYRGGQPVRFIKDKHHQFLFHRGEQQIRDILDAVEENGELSVRIDSDFALDILRVNYKVWHGEVTLAGCLSDAHVVEIVKAFIDLPGVLETLKKKTHEST